MCRGVGAQLHSQPVVSQDIWESFTSLRETIQTFPSAFLRRDLPIFPYMSPLCPLIVNDIPSGEDTDCMEKHKEGKEQHCPNSRIRE